jgi:hypothetical protein
VEAAARAKSQPGPVYTRRQPEKTALYQVMQLHLLTFGFELLCSKCKGALRLVALIKSEEVARKILTAMHLPTEVPELHPARPPPGTPGAAGSQEGAGERWLN